MNISIRKTNLLFIFTLLLGINYTYSQGEYDYDDESEYQNSPSRTYFMDMNMLVSISNMDSRFKHTPVGLDFNFLYQIKKSNSVFLIAGFKWMGYGSGYYTYYDYDPFDGYEYQFSQNFNNNLWSFNIGGRYFSKKSYWIFNPYAEVDLRYNIYYGFKTTNNNDTGDIIDSKFMKSNSALGYSVGIGTLINISSEYYFPNISINYHGGDNIGLYYRDYSNDFVDDVTDNYDFAYFPISFFEIKFGITAKF
ncbi:MAG: hypothetical protein R2771_04035 [Saprospiraceae bacterium]